MGEIVNLSAYRSARSHRAAAVQAAQTQRTTTSVTRPQREPLLREVYGDVLRGLRLERGERLTDVAGRAAISPQYLSEIERGRKDASSEILAAIAGSLDLPMRALSSHLASRMAVNSRGPVCLAA